MNEKDKKQLDLTSEDFEFVQAEEKIFDKKFETKPIGYFKDAMIRFSKNRTNVIATIILFSIILGTIIFPLVSNKNASELEEELSFLPPRVPILENYGIFDGTSLKTEEPVDPSTINNDEYPEIPEGLGIPTGYPVASIDMDTLTNYEIPCSTKDESCRGGLVEIAIDAESSFVRVVSTDFVTFIRGLNPTLTIDIDNISDGTELDLYLLVGSDYQLLETFTEAGEFTIEPFETFNTTTYISSKLRFEYRAENNRQHVAIESITVNDDSSEEPVFEHTGYEISNYEIDASEGGAGRIVRSGAGLLVADFQFNNYIAQFGNKREVGFSANNYDEIIAENPQCVRQDNAPDSENPDGWTFPETCPIQEVIKQNESVVVDGVEYYSYELILNYQLYAGYDELPYYLFGTDQAGRDLFKLLWIGTRTSLLIGFVVSAINITIGIIYGSISGYYGGTVDLLMQRFSEIVGRIPWLVTLAIFIAFFGPGLKTLIFILVISGWIGIAGITRTQFYRYKGREYVLASRTLGAKDSRLIFRHILPNGIGTIITTSILSIPYVIFSESTLSYLGFGIGHGQDFRVFGFSFTGVSVGVLLSDARNYLVDRPYLTLFPAILISILMITFNMFGNALRDAFNPALRGSE
ncbi:MAG: ABC transporter permease [Candidatus Izemoplasma sp.]|nr:ABC transporter permease [Candidatus Izemoplasma sp.]